MILIRRELFLAGLFCMVMGFVLATLAFNPHMMLLGSAFPIAFDNRWVKAMRASAFEASGAEEPANYPARIGASSVS